MAQSHIQKKQTNKQKHIKSYDLTIKKTKKKQINISLSLYKIP